PQPLQEAGCPPPTASAATPTRPAASSIHAVHVHPSSFRRFAVHGEHLGPVPPHEPARSWPRCGEEQPAPRAGTRVFRILRPTRRGFLPRARRPCVEPAEEGGPHRRRSRHSGACTTRAQRTPEWLAAAAQRAPVESGLMLARP